MRKIGAFCCCMLLVAGCAEHDPILPGLRTPVFNTNNINILNTDIKNLPDNIAVYVKNIINNIFDLVCENDRPAAIWIQVLPVFIVHFFGADCKGGNHRETGV